MLDADIPGSCERFFARGETILGQGETVACLFVVRSGLVKLVAVSHDGREASTDLLGRGQVFGEQCLRPDQLPSPDSAVGLLAGRIRIVPRASIQRAGSMDPRVAGALVQAFAERLERTTRALHDSMLDPAPVRIARRLAWLAREHGTPRGHHVVLSGAFTQRELASLCGSSRETVNRVLGRLAALGLVRVRPCGYHVADVDALERWPGLHVSDSETSPSDTAPRNHPSRGAV